jgi:hypothetical protein
MGRSRTGSVPDPLRFDTDPDLQIRIPRLFIIYCLLMGVSGSGSGSVQIITDLNPGVPKPTDPTVPYPEHLKRVWCFQTYFFRNYLYLCPVACSSHKNYPLGKLRYIRAQPSQRPSCTVYSSKFLLFRKCMCKIGVLFCREALRQPELCILLWWACHFIVSNYFLRFPPVTKVLFVLILIWWVSPFEDC